VSKKPRSSARDEYFSYYIMAESETEQDFEDCGSTEGKFKFNGRYLYLTYSKSNIGNKEDFEARLMVVLPERSKVYGCKELHKDGTPHYHCLVRFGERQNWPDARKRLAVDAVNALRIIQPRKGQRMKQFLANVQRYIEKHGDLFGERLHVGGAASEERLMKWQEVVDEPDPVKGFQLLRALDPRAIVVNNLAVAQFFNGKRKRDVSDVGERCDYSEPWSVPKLFHLWKERFIDNPFKGRPKSLVIVGDPDTGKTAWGTSFGRPIVMNSRWDMSAIFDGATHIVVSDVRPFNFGFGGTNYWRETIGGQNSFRARDFQKATRLIEAGWPCIWTSNWDNDPRKDRAVAQYMKTMSWVFEVRDRKDEKSWGRLFIPSETVVEEEKDEALAEAMREASEYMGEYVDEAVDVCSEF
jgi:hypothetical protein